MKLRTTTRVFCTALIGVCLSASADAQNFGQATTRSFVAQNSANRFSVGQIQQQINSRSFGAVGVAGVNRRTFGDAFSASNNASKPFSSLNRGPSVSPYLALSGSLNSVSDYYNIVRPRQDFRRQREVQERQNQLAQRQIMANQHRLNQLAARAPYDIRGDENQAPTGHAVTLMHFDNFQNRGGFFGAVQGLNKQQP